MKFILIEICLIVIYFNSQIKTRTESAIGKREGKIHNKTRMEVIKSAEKRILEDRKEREQSQIVTEKKTAEVTYIHREEV